MTEKTTKKIQCPHCGCNPHNGFNLVEHLDTEDDEIKDFYDCPKCGKKSVRCYKFTKWENVEVKKKATGFFVNTNISSLPRGL
jgi:ribosomal protein L37AE/L43A